jgi:hypothetical protein
MTAPIDWTAMSSAVDRAGLADLRRVARLAIDAYAADEGGSPFALKAREHLYEALDDLVAAQQPDRSEGEGHEEVRQV